MSKLRGATGINVFDLPDENLHALDHIIGKQVEVKDKQGKKHKGVLQFVGTNPLLKSWGLHCTINRVPGIKIKSISDIVLLETIEES